MKKFNWLLLVLVSLIALSACDEKDEESEIVPQQPQSSVNVNTDSLEIEENVSESKPVWIQGFPNIKHGATSADLTFQADKSSKVYFVVSEAPLSLSPSQVISEAVSPALPEIKFNGSISLEGNQSAVQKLSSLAEGKEYFSYLLLTTVNDTIANDTIGSSLIQELKFKTQVRQDTSHFTSTSENRRVDFLLYRPEESFKDPQKKFPIIFFLGGQGERAHGNKRINVIQNGLLPEYIHKGNDVPMIVLSVQHVSKNWKNELITEAMDYAMTNLPVDKTKVYMIGTSAGAFGVWKFSQQFPDRLTAIVPISGGGDKNKGCSLTDLSVWAFHNKQDNLVSPEDSKEMVDAINKCNPSKQAKLQVFPDAGHDCWRRIFDPNHPDWAKSPNVPRIHIFNWLLEQSRPTAN